MKNNKQNSELIEFTCPACGGQEIDLSTDGFCVCQYCGKKYLPPANGEDTNNVKNTLENAKKSASELAAKNIQTDLDNLTSKRDPHLKKWNKLRSLHENKTNYKRSAIISSITLLVTFVLFFFGALKDIIVVSIISAIIFFFALISSIVFTFKSISRKTSKKKYHEMASFMNPLNRKIEEKRKELRTHQSNSNQEKRNKRIDEGKKVLYDLYSVEEIESIAIPNYLNLKTKGLSAFPTNNIEYILQKKAAEHKLNGDMDLAIACLRKANEIYPYSNFSWTKIDYLRLVRYLKDAGKLDEAKTEKEKINKLFRKKLHDPYMRKIITNCRKLKTDLVQTSDNSCVCGDCAKYTKRIFSLYGKDKRFPKLPDYIWLDIPGHEHCVITLSPFIYGVSDPTWEYSGDLMTWSNRPLIDERSAQQKTYFEKLMK